MVRSITKGNEFKFLKTPFTEKKTGLEGEFRVPRNISFFEEIRQSGLLYVYVHLIRQLGIEGV